MQMAGENVALARRLLEAFGRRDVDTLLEISDPDIAFFAPTGELVTGDAAYWGHDGIRDYFDDVEAAWEELSIAPSEYREVGDHVLAMGSVNGRRDGGQIFSSPAQWVLRIRDGKVVYGCVYTDKDEALDAAGLGEAEGS